MSTISTHVLDTAIGKPAAGLKITLQKPAIEEGHWEDIVSGVTNEDGRVPDFIPDGIEIDRGIYRMYFDTGGYFDAMGFVGFYPYVPVVFTIHDESHYHVPLLLNPYGYSTYRGS